MYGEIVLIDLGNCGSLDCQYMLGQEKANILTCVLTSDEIAVSYISQNRGSWFCGDE